MKKIISFFFAFLIVFNLIHVTICSALASSDLVCQNNSNTYRNNISVYEYFNSLQELTDRYTQSDSLQGGSVTVPPNNRLIVKTKSNAPLENTYGAVGVVEGFDGLHVLQYETETKANNAYNLLLKDDIVYVEHDFWVELLDGSMNSRVPQCYCPNDSLIIPGCDCPENKEKFYFCTKPDDTIKNYLSWASSAIQSEEAFRYIKEHNIECNPVKVAVFDTGVYAQHDYFSTKGARISTPCPKKYMLTSTDEETGEITYYPSDVDDQFHGTHVTGILYDNTMDNVEIYSYRIFGPSYSLQDFAVLDAALKAAMNEGIDIINMSIGQSYAENDVPYTLFDTMKYAVNNGIVLVSAAGNEGTDVGRLLPGCYEKGITVAATNIANNPDKTYSNYGSVVDIAAPGTDILSTVPRNVINDKYYQGDYDYTIPQSMRFRLSGTSQAAPLVSAAAALIKSIDPDITPAEVERIIKETAYVPEGWGESEKENEPAPNYGTGIVNFYNIAKAMLGEKSSTPVISKTTDNKFEISLPDGIEGDIFYTLDGSEPTTVNGLLYSEPIDLSDKNVNEIKAVCHESGKVCGDTAVKDLVMRKSLKLDYKETYMTMPYEYAYKGLWFDTDKNIADSNYKGEITGKSPGTSNVVFRLANGERIIYTVTVDYSLWQKIIIYFFFGFLWYI